MELKNTSRWPSWCTILVDRYDRLPERYIFQCRIPISLAKLFNGHELTFLFPTCTTNVQKNYFFAHLQPYMYESYHFAKQINNRTTESSA